MSVDWIEKTVMYKFIRHELGEEDKLAEKQITPTKHCTATSQTTRLGLDVGIGDII